ncbi:MAG: ATPase [Deltaproteobacteria bacterium]|jgi:signal transduction histidine kinase/Na+/proline symporter|nr:ATPase [Deltaproteobacteria bacterium]
MDFELSTLFVFGSVYLAFLFGIAFITDRGWIPKKIVRHPLVYVLSMGVFASVWFYFNSIGLAQRSGYGYVSSAIGISLAFLLSPLLLQPILDLTRTYQLSSLADLIAFRYRSPFAGTLTTSVILVGSIALIALQIRVVADTADVLTTAASHDSIAIGFCTLITLFAVLFGTSKEKNREQHDGLVMAIAFESLVKLLAFLIIGGFSVYGGFGGFESMVGWVESQSLSTFTTENSTNLSQSQILIVVFFAASVTMPHMFYTTFTENNSRRALSFASWGLPLYFFLMSLPVIPILWAGIKSGSSVQVEYYPVIIGDAYGKPFLSLLGYMGGLSAASGLIIVITLALSNMCLNHIVLPLRQPSPKQNIYTWLIWRRRILISALIWAGFALHYLPPELVGIGSIGAMAFITCLQFLPGVVAILYWPQGNKRGYIAGIAASSILLILYLFYTDFAQQSLINWRLVTEQSAINWRLATALSLSVNVAVFAIVSLLYPSDEAELNTANICSLDNLRRPHQGELVAKSVGEFIENLKTPLGFKTATREVKHALKELKITKDDQRPYALRLLRDRLEVNLSELLGPKVGRGIIETSLPYTVVPRNIGTDLNVIEIGIEAYRSNLSGVAADLDNLRQYHRNILFNLPIGICSLGPNNEIVMWNRELENFTGIKSNQVIGSQTINLPEPWQSILEDFSENNINQTDKKSFFLNNIKKTVKLHKSIIEREIGPGHNSSTDGLIILVEDLTDTENLEAGLAHSQRLASIGRLAAGVAHEIGNPITGIACLAQTIRDEFESKELQELSGEIIAQTDRTSKILQSLVNFAHTGTNQKLYSKQKVVINDCITDAKTLISLDKKSANLLYIFNIDPEAAILGDSQRLLQVFVNLINNARDASQQGGKITTQTSIERNTVKITIEDEGSGIPDSLQDRVFDPFFTTKEPGEGTGLGLSLVFSIVEDLNGNIDIVSSTKESISGTKVTLRFPKYQTPNKAMELEYNAPKQSHSSC